MKIKFGNIRLEEIEKAKEALVKQYKSDDGSWIPKKIWFNKPYYKNIVKGYAYDDVEEVLEHETIYALHSFQNIIHVEHFIKEHEYIFFKKELETFKNIFEQGKTAYMVGGVVGDNKESLCWGNIEHGQFIWQGTVEEAYNYLKTRSCLNSLVKLITVGILNDMVV